MCGIVGFISKTTPRNLDAVKNLLLESQIRGKHSTGVTYVFNSELKTVSYPISSTQFINEYWSEIEHDLIQENKIVLIGHTRYATSGDYLQPVTNSDNTAALVLNGVITQEDFSNWEKLFNLNNFKTENDAEIFLKWIESNASLSSMYKKYHYTCAYIYLNLKKGEMQIGRTGDRPLYYSIFQNRDIVFTNDDYIAFGSTKAILSRAKIKSVNFMPCNFSTIIDFKSQNKLYTVRNIEAIDTVELQKN